MKTNVIRIGNSRGIRLPKPVLEQCRLEGEVEFEVREGELIIRSASRPRSGWGDAFRRMSETGDDALLDRDSLPRAAWDQAEWKW